MDDRRRTKRRPEGAPGRANGERARADCQDLSGTRGRDGRAAGVLSKEERLLLLRLLKKLGKGGVDES